MTKPVDPEFGRLRALFWPIRRKECRKVVPMLLMGFLICFCYSMLRPIKDTVVVTAAGAEVIPFIKVWVLLPMAFLFTFIFTHLTHRFSQEKVFYIMVSSFLLYFALFGFVLYPMSDSFHAKETASWLKESLPLGLHGMVEMLSNWSLTLFYVIAELWGSIILSVVFWGFANEVTRLGEVRRFYGVMTVGANIGAVAAGFVANFFARATVFPRLPVGKTPWEQTLATLLLVIICCGVTAMLIFRWMNKNVVNTEEYATLHGIQAKEKKKRLSIRDSFSYLSRSKYLACIAILVVSYNLTINLVEVVWKGQLRLQYPNPSDFNGYMNSLTSVMGIISTCTSFFMASMLGRFGWGRVAMITPVLMLVTGAGFFTFFLFGESVSGVVMALTGTTPLVMANLFGAAQNCLSKAAKYSVFDATKEMSFIPLDHEYRLKGKAAIDGIGSRLGKSGGSLIHQGLLLLFGTLRGSAPIVAATLIGVIALWMTAVRSLGRQLQKLVAKEDLGLAEEEQETALA